MNRVLKKKTGCQELLDEGSKGEAKNRINYSFLFTKSVQKVSKHLFLAEKKLSYLYTCHNCSWSQWVAACDTGASKDNEF